MGVVILSETKNPIHSSDSRTILKAMGSFGLRLPAGRRACLPVGRSFALRMTLKNSCHPERSEGSLGFQK